MFLLNKKERNYEYSNTKFTIQNVSIKSRNEIRKGLSGFDLQYKMFLLNLISIPKFLNHIPYLQYKMFLLNSKLY